MAADFDTVIRGGQIVDGSGAAGFEGDVAGTHVHAVGLLPRHEPRDVVPHERRKPRGLFRPGEIVRL